MYIDKVLEFSEIAEEIIKQQKHCQQIAQQLNLLFQRYYPHILIDVEKNLMGFFESKSFLEANNKNEEFTLTFAGENYTFTQHHHSKYLIDVIYSVKSDGIEISISHNTMMTLKNTLIIEAKNGSNYPARRVKNAKYYKDVAHELEKILIKHQENHLNILDLLYVITIDKHAFNTIEQAIEYLFEIFFDRFCQEPLVDK